MATDLPYPLPNPRPCGCAGIPVSAYGEPEKPNPSEESGRMGGLARGALALGGIAAVFVAMSILLPPEKEKPTVFGYVKPRKSLLP